MEIILTGPYYDYSTGYKIITFSKPIVDSDLNLKGVMGVDL